MGHCCATLHAYDFVIKRAVLCCIINQYKIQNLSENYRTFKSLWTSRIVKGTETERSGVTGERGARGEGAPMDRHGASL